jgi:hypothetical protein
LAKYHYFPTQTFDFGFEAEDSTEGMKAMIITEVAAFRQQIRNQIRAAPVRRETYVQALLTGRL